jgi:hypothetical protein
VFAGERGVLGPRQVRRRGPRPSSMRVRRRMDGRCMFRAVDKLRGYLALHGMHGQQHVELLHGVHGQLARRRLQHAVLPVGERVPGVPRVLRSRLVLDRWRQWAAGVRLSARLDVRIAQRLLHTYSTRSRLALESPLPYHLACFALLQRLVWLLRAGESARATECARQTWRAQHACATPSSTTTRAPPVRPHCCPIPIAQSIHASPDYTRDHQSKPCALDSRMSAQAASRGGA